MPHQVNVLKETERFNKCAHYLKMGLGKTFTGAEKLVRLGEDYNLLICQKSKVNDWINHFKTFYPNIPVVDFTKKGATIQPGILVINYELSWRRLVLKELTEFTLMLDESSNVMHENTKQAKFISNLCFKNLVLLSGTPCGGRYELLRTQLNMLGWKLSKGLFLSQYCEVEKIKIPGGRVVNKIVGYKNIERLKRKSEEYGCVWMETEEALELPPIIEQKIKVMVTPEYKEFMKNCIITVNDRGNKFYDNPDFRGMDMSLRVELVGDTPLKKLLYARQLCGFFSMDKVQAFKDLLSSTDDRVVVFYNFKMEFELLKTACEKLDRPLSIINGQIKDLNAFDELTNAVTLVQYQAGAMGLNLQKSNRIVYFSPPVQWELFEQSKARIRRIGQDKTCFYYYLVCAGSVEERIYRTLAERKNYDEVLFEKDFK